ncbi:MAG: ROK family protein [Sulfitobacter sp.]
MKPDTSPVKRQHLRDIRISNRARILQVLREPTPISRQELAERLELTPASLSRISKELIADGICVEAPLVRDEAQRGRPGVALRINAQGGFLIAISISSFSRLISIVDISGGQHHQQLIPVHVTTSGPDTVEFIGRYIDQLVATNKLDRRRVLGATLTIPGSINVQSGFLTKSILLNWPDFAIQEQMSQRLGCHVRVENNGDALCRYVMDKNFALAEQHSSVFLAHISEGMGASIAIGGRIVRRLADEGWINDIKVPAQTPGCKNEQALSQLASGRAILKEIQEARQDLEKNGTAFNAQLEVAVEWANKDQKYAIEAFFAAGYQLGNNLVPLTIAIAPDVIVLAGPVLQADAYSSGVRAGYEKAAAEMDINPSKIIVCRASYGDASENLALHDFFLSGAYGA